MSLREILTYPDPRLREISIAVDVFDAQLEKLTNDMIETMYHAHGIGLAAPQVGVLKRVIVIDTRPKDDEGRRYEVEEMGELEAKIPQPLVLINPRIVTGTGTITFDEGCLSVPSFYETVERKEIIEVETHDLSGKKYKFKTDGLLAICIQHELDHLEGKLFIDRISFLKSKKIKGQIQKHGYPDKKEKSEVKK